MAKKQRKKSDSKITAMRVEEKKRSFEDMVTQSLQKEQEEQSKTRVTKAIDASNKGNRMLQAMGRSQGQGLGRNSSGITDPLTARGLGSSSERAGIGIQGGVMGLDEHMSSVPEEGQSYQAFARNRARQRFEQAGGHGQVTGAGSAGQSSSQNVTADDYLALMNKYNQSNCRDEDALHRPMLK